MKHAIIFLLAFASCTNPRQTNEQVAQSEPLMLVNDSTNNQYGYRDMSNKMAIPLGKYTYAIVISPQFDCAYPFENGKAKVSTNCKTVADGEHRIWTSDEWQYVDKKGVF